MGKRKIILSTDSACDLSKEFIEKYNIHSVPFYIHLDGKQYKDGIDILPDDIYKIYGEKKILPKTAAIGSWEYRSYFQDLKKEGDDIIHINLSSGISSTHQNCVIASEELENIYPVDSLNLSTGISILVLEAAKMIEEGLDAPCIQEKLSLLSKKVKSSFVVNDLSFLKSGGRCSSVASIGAKLLGIKPCIEVNQDGRMVLGKKYRGSFDKVILKYACDILENISSIDENLIFITHAGTSEEYIKMVYEKLKEADYFKNIYIQRAGCTISSHCGPDTLGLMYLLK